MALQSSRGPLWIKGDQRGVTASTAQDSDRRALERWNGQLEKLKRRLAGRRGALGAVQCFIKGTQETPLSAGVLCLSSWGWITGPATALRW